jgi:hypothetical protein
LLVGRHKIFLDKSRLDNGIIDLLKRFASGPRNDNLITF